MPHYADGTEAKVGDQVTGKLYNSEGVKAGVIVSITPGAESCNAMVQFTEVLVNGSSAEGKVPRMARKTEEGVEDVRHQLSEQHQSSGPTAHIYTCVDFCATNELTKVSA